MGICILPCLPSRHYTHRSKSCWTYFLKSRFYYKWKKDLELCKLGWRAICSSSFPLKPKNIATLKPFIETSRNQQSRRIAVTKKITRVVRKYLWARTRHFCLTRSSFLLVLPRMFPFRSFSSFAETANITSCALESRRLNFLSGFLLCFTAKSKKGSFVSLFPFWLSALYAKFCLLSFVKEGAANCFL